MPEHIVVANAIEKNHIMNLLNSNRRLDGRGKEEFRKIKIETGVVGTAHGSAIAHIGKTKVICGVKAVLSSPWSDYPNKGSIFVGAEHSPLSGPAYKVGPPRDPTIELARVTDRAIRESDCVNLEDLLIIEGEKCWTLNIDLYTLDDYGNLFDACVIAAFAALSTAMIPEIKVENGEVTVLDTVRPVKINSYPISVTTYKLDNHLVVDAEYREEQIADARITFGTTQHYIVSGQKGGRGAFKSDEIIQALTQSIQTASKIRVEVCKQLGIELPE